MEFKHLFSPIKIGEMTVKNRIALPSMGLMYTYDSVMNDRFKRFYYERAKGGAGLLITGPYAVDKAGGGIVLLGLDEDRFLPELKEFNNNIHQIDEVKVAVQLFHAGRYNLSFMAGGQPVSASPIPSKLTGETPRELSAPELKELAQDYGKAAVRAREAGFDAVEILACTGYLLSQFLSPLTNIRSDEYGGSFENRLRFPLEVVEAVRKAVGGDYPLIVRVAGNDFMPDGYTNEDTQKVCQAFVKAGIDAVNVTGGWHETIIPQLTYAVPEGAFAYLSRGIKEAVEVPVLASNRMGDPEIAEKVLREGFADMICLGRPLIADPYLPQKAMEGRVEDIVPCVGCNQVCFDNVFAGQPVGCMMNPIAGFEGEYAVIQAEKPKKVVVAGGGPAGMKAASTAANRGHEVILFEQGEELGGQLHLASATPDKGDFRKIIKILAREVEKAGVKVKLQTRVTAEIIRQEEPDAVIIASGAEPITPSIPGIDGPNVIQAWDYIRGNKEAGGENIVVIGGSASGCETALMIAREGTISPEIAAFLFYHEAETPEKIRELMTNGIKKVTVVDMLHRLADNVARTTRWALLKDMKIHKIKMMSNTKVTAVNDEGVVVEQEGEGKTLPADTIILAVGVASQKELHDGLKDAVPELYLIGDARLPRKIVEAISEGFQTGLNI